MSGYLHLNNKQNFQGEFFSVSDNSPLKEFGKASYINIFIGANNSRKSRFMRKLLNEESSVETSEKTLCLLNEVSDLFKSILIESKKHSKGTIVELTIGLNQNGAKKWEHYEGWEQFIQLIKSNNPRQLTINEDYFNKTNQVIIAFFSDLKEDKFENFITSIRNNIILFRFLVAYDRTSLSRLGITNVIGFNHYLGTPGYALFQSQLTRLQSLLESLTNTLFTFYRPVKIYIPILRTAVSLYVADKEVFRKLTQNIYATTLKKHYGLYSISDKLNVFTGLELYNSIKKDRNSRKDIRKRFEAFEEFISANFFQGKNVEVIALEDQEPENQHIQLYIEGENDRELHDLGDGVQALIIMLYPIFMAEAGTWLFIEEPELNMHPGLQHLFIRTLLTHPAIREKKLRFFMTSHSNHLLNFSLSHADAISVFSFEKQTTGTELRSNIRQVIGHDVEILNLLGVYNASVYMANCSLWVEGVSDRRYLSAFLFAYMRDGKKEKFHEDLHYGFFEYAGSNVSHYLFDTTVKAESDEFNRIKAHFLANRIFLLVDKDAGLSKQKKQQQLQEVSTKSDKFEFVTTEVIEVENLLSVPVLKLLLKDLLKVDGGVVDSLQCKEKDYRDTRVGSYLKGILPQHKLPAIEDKSGTLTTPYKVKFADYVLEQVEKGTITWTMIAKNQAAKKLTEKLYDFIYRHNHP